MTIARGAAVILVERAVDHVRRPVLVFSILVSGVCALRLSLVLVSTQLFHTSLLYFGDDGLVSRFAGTAPRPYCYRVLTDWLLRGVTDVGLTRIRIGPLDAVVRVAQASQHAVPAASFEQIKAYGLVATLLAFGFMLLVFLAALRLLHSYFWATLTVLLASLIVNSIQLQGYSQPYDFSTLFFSALLFWLMTRENEKLFSAWFPLACLAKESLYLLVIASVFASYRRQPIRNILGHLTFRTAAFIIIYGWQRSAFAANAGAPMYHNIPGHIHMLVEHVDIYDVWSALFAFSLPFFSLPLKHPALKGGLCVLPVLGILYIWGGNPGEFRIIFELLPIVIISAMDSLKRLVMDRGNSPRAVGSDDSSI